MRSSFLLAILAAALFGAATPASKLLLRDASPALLAALLYAGAALGALPTVLRRSFRRRARAVPRRDLLRLLAAVAFGGVLGPLLVLGGLRLASSTSVSLWLNLEFVATALLGQAFFHDHLDRDGLAGVIGMLAASVLLPGAVGAAAGVGPGILVAAGCVCWGLDNHLTAVIGSFTPGEITFWKGLGAAGCNLALVLGMGLPVPAFGTALGGVGVGALSYGLSIALYISAARGLGATRAQVLFATSPFFGAILSGVVLREAASGRHVAAAVLMLASATLILRGRRRHEHEHFHARLEHEHRHVHDDSHHDHLHEAEPRVHPAGAPSPPAGERHTHRHLHEPVRHRHPHWPDQHHRHPHGS